MYYNKNNKILKIVYKMYCKPKNGTKKNKEKVFKKIHECCLTLKMLLKKKNQKKVIKLGRIFQLSCMVSLKTD